MNLTHYSTNRYGNNSGLLTMQKQSQNKPNQSQFKPNFNPKKSKRTQTNPIYGEQAQRVEPFMVPALRSPQGEEGSLPALSKVEVSNPRNFKNTPAACLKSYQIRTEFQRQKTSISSSQAYRCIGLPSYCSRCKRRFLSACRTSCMAYIHTIDTLLHPLKK